MNLDDYQDGVLVAALTAFRDDFSIDWDEQRASARRLRSVDGVRGFVVNAYAAEGPTLTGEERNRLIALYREVAGDDPAVVAAILDLSTAGAVRQAQEAKQAGADALLICPPVVASWNAQASPEIAYEYHRAILESVDLPAVLFQMAVGDGSAYSHELLISLARDFEQVIAVKMAQASDAVRYDRDYLALRELPKKVLALPAVGSSMFHACMTGADGILTGLASFAPYEIVELYRSATRGDLRTCREIHLRLAPMNHMIYAHPYADLHTRYKELAYLAGAIGSPVVRPPMRRVSRDEQARLKACLETAGLRRLPERD